MTGEPNFKGERWIILKKIFLKNKHTLLQLLPPDLDQYHHIHTSQARWRPEIYHFRLGYPALSTLNIYTLPSKILDSVRPCVMLILNVLIVLKREKNGNLTYVHNTRTFSKFLCDVLELLRSKRDICLHT